MSLSASALSQTGLSEARSLTQQPRRAPTKRTLVVQRDLTTVPEAR